MRAVKIIVISGLSMSLFGKNVPNAVHRRFSLKRRRKNLQNIALYVAGVKRKRIKIYLISDIER